MTYVRLLGWAKQEPRHMSLAIPMIWTKRKDHVSDCHFQQTHPKKNVEKAISERDIP